MFLAGIVLGWISVLSCRKPLLIILDILEALVGLQGTVLFVRLFVLSVSFCDWLMDRCVHTS